MRVLIVLPGAIGDVVRGLPLLGRLRHAWPQAHLAWAVEPLSAPVLDGHPWLDDVVRIDRRSVAGFVATLRRVRRERFDLALDLGRGIRSGLVLAATGAPQRLGFDRRDGREGSWLFANRRLAVQGTARAKLEQFLAFATLLDLPDSPVAFGLAPAPAATARARALLGDASGRLVGASLGSSCPSRRWFPEETASVLERAAAVHGATPVLLGTDADTPFAREVGAQLSVPHIDLTGRTSLSEVIAVLSRLQLVVGPDSGTLHLAAALGIPVVSLWGATSARRSAPWGAERWALEGSAPCRPCFLHSCPIDRLCMRAITVPQVAAAAAEALAA